MKVNESIHGTAVIDDVAMPIDILNAVYWSDEIVKEIGVEESKVVVEFVDDSEDIFNKYCNWEICENRGDSLCMDNVCFGKNVLPLEWILGWCAKDLDSYLNAKEMMWERYSGLNKEERSMYRKGLIVFYKKMCESSGISVDVPYIRLVESGVIYEMSYGGC